MREWDQVSIGDIAVLVPGGTPSTSVSKFWDGKIPWCTPTDITGTRGRLLLETARKITEEGLASCSATIVPEGSLLLCTRATVGEVRIAGRPTSTNQGFKTLIAKKPHNNTFIYFLLQTLKSEMLSLASGSTFLELGTRELASIKVRMPNPQEQLLISIALSDAEDQVFQLNAAIAKKKDLQTAITQQLLKGTVRLPGFKDDWKTVKLGDYSSFYKGQGLSKKLLSNSGTRSCLLYGELFTTYGRVINSVLSRTDSNEGVKSMYGDVLLPGSTTTTGADLATASAILLDDVQLSGDVNIVRPDLTRISPIYLAYHLTLEQRDAISMYTQGTTIHHLYGRHLADLTIGLPSLAEQIAIAEVLIDIQLEIDALEAQRDKAEKIKLGMISDLLSGTVRLV